MAIDELAETKVFGESAARLSDLVKVLMDIFVFQPVTEQQTMELAARSLGRLVGTGGALMADVVEEQVRGPGTGVCARVRGRAPALARQLPTLAPTRHQPTTHAALRSSGAFSGWQRPDRSTCAWRACWCSRSWLRTRPRCSTCTSGARERRGGAAGSA